MYKVHLENDVLDRLFDESQTDYYSQENIDQFSAWSQQGVNKAKTLQEKRKRLRDMYSGRNVLI